ncbi:MAG: hypothetical protein Q8N57_00070 [bacterium]|nr:hypothetical protein [bacterium]
MKNFFRRLLASKKKRLLAALVALSFVLFYFVLSMLLVSPTEISLEKLRRSWREDLICHETCAAEREAAISEIAKELRDHPDSKGARRLKEYFLDEKNETDFRISLIGIIKEADGPDNPPGYIKDFMAQGDNPLIRAAILTAFSASALDAGNNPLDYYYKILAGNDDLAVKLAAIGALSSLADKPDLFNSGQLELIKKIIFNSGTDKRLRQPLILLLSDYYPVLPAETKSILTAYYLTESSGDSISRAFAADSLNRLGGEELVVPEVSAPEWDEYYNN